MRRTSFVLMLGFLAAAAVFAQRGGGHGGGGGMHGGGGGMHAGGGISGGGGFRGGAGFRGGVNGFRGNIGFRNNFAFRGTRFFGFSPFSYSGFYGGYPFLDYSDYGYGYPDYGSASYGYPYDGSYTVNSGGYPAPQSYAPPPPPPAPVIREYIGPPTQAQSNEPPLYLIAFQDGVIRAALAYWVDGATLHYVDLDHAQKQAPLASVDRALSDRLNGERHVEFRLAH
jgi:hypothetical protein